jgi:inosine-uridine nucleoside N-ribohydrolase
MSTTRRDYLKTAAAALGIARSSLAARAQSPGASRPQAKKRKVIFDQDNIGPLGTDILGQLLLMQADNIDLLGITLVSGDAWVKQEAAYTLRLLELMDRPDIPVYLGAEMPMLNTKEEALLRYQLYGGHRLDPWLGAFNRDNGGPDDVKPLAAPYGRFAELRPQPEHAARFIVKAVRENPHEVTLYAGGPLTNLALAIKLAPDIVPLVPELVIMGTGLHKFTSAFNIFFDAEAARMVLRAPWPACRTITVDLAEEIHLGDDLRPGRKMIEEIAERAHSPIRELFLEHAIKPYRSNPQMRWFRMPDEMIAMQIVDPTIFSQIDKMYVDICTDSGARYGDSMLWDADWKQAAGAGGEQWYMGPPPSAGLVDVIKKVNADRFKQSFVDLMVKPIRKA